MAVTGVNNSVYTSYYDKKYDNSVKKDDAKENNVNDYSKYLQSKYNYMNTGTTSMQGIPTTVAVSSAFLKKCMNDPEKAKYLEENLAAIPDCAKSAVAGCQGTLTNLSYLTQYTDTVSISKIGQESFRHLSSVSSMDYQNRFEKEVTDIFAKEDTENVKSDSFEHHVNRMAAAYNKMKNSIEEKYAEQDYEPEYYVTESGKIEELTKEKEMDMLNQAYENHSNFMATSTEIWSELQDFTPSIVYHKGSEQTQKERNLSESQENNAKSKESGVIKNTAYQAFLSAIQTNNQKLSQQYSGDWKDLRLSLNISDGDRKMLNGIWDYYANKR